MFRGLIASLVDIVYPRICLVCKKSLKNISSIDDFVCSSCWQQIKKNIPPFCFCCGRHLKNPSNNKSICPACLKRPLYFDRAFSPCAYDGVVKELIHEFKYNQKEHLGSTLAQLMSDFIKEYNLPVEYMDYIIPVPLHKTRRRQREFNQAHTLSKHLAREFNKEVRDSCLMRVRNTKTQTELEPHRRFTNVEGSFRVENRELVKGKNILLVDDVLTTGATSSEAARCLKSAGARIVFVMTLAN